MSTETGFDENVDVTLPVIHIKKADPAVIRLGYNRRDGIIGYKPASGENDCISRPAEA